MAPRVDPGELLAIFAGGFIGAIARWRLAVALAAAPGHWPWATFAANVAGAFALGCLLSSIYGFLSGAWPFGVVELIWAGIAVRRYQQPIAA